MASTFADPGDIRRFKAAKERGMTDKQAFAYGDNGIGCWGDDTTADIPMCALPPEVWQKWGVAARGKRIEVKRGAALVVCELRDTMPRIRNIRNGAGIDLNPAAARALGIRIPGMEKVLWRPETEQTLEERVKASGIYPAPAGVNRIMELVRRLKSILGV